MNNNNFWFKNITTTLQINNQSIRGSPKLNDSKILIQASQTC